MIFPTLLSCLRSQAYASNLLQDKNDFEQSTLPALVPVLNSAAGETLLLLVRHAELIINKVMQLSVKLPFIHMITIIQYFFPFLKNSSVVK